MSDSLSAAERDRATCFRTAFNEVEQLLRRGYVATRTPLPEIIRAYSQLHPAWKYKDRLLWLANVRNELAHTEGSDSLAIVPTEHAVAELRRIKKSITWLQAVGSRYKRRVECVEAATKLSHVLRLVRSKDYSQFPVIDAGRIRGLVTENAIARWLAYNFEGAGIAEELRTISVKTVLAAAEDSSAFRKITVDTSTEAAMSLFSHPGLEALLITKSQRAELPLVGIITRWDVLQLLG
jgi:predicted transcriptional regulator